MSATDPIPAKSNDRIPLLDKKSPMPLHAQMEEYIRAKLASGEWPASYLLPSENELGRYFGVSRMTVRNVTSKLVQEGLIYRIPGKGTYVSETKFEARSLVYAGIREQLEQKGFEVSTKLLSAKVTEVPERVSRNFSPELGNRFFEIIRLRYLKKTPLSIHVSYVPERLAPGLDKQDLETAQLCYLLSKKFDLNRSKTTEVLESVAATPEQAKLLEIPVNSPLLLLHDVITNPASIVFEYAEVAFRGEKIKLFLEF